MTTDQDMQEKRARLQQFIGKGPSQASTGGVNHLAVFARDLEKTADFYSRVLGMPVVSVTANRDEPQSTHMNVDMGNGMSFAFFDFPHVDRIQIPIEEGIGGMMHVAIDISEARYQEVQARLTAEGIPAQRINNSVYLKDPNGMTIELGIVNP